MTFLWEKKISPRVSINSTSGEVQTRLLINYCSCHMTVSINSTSGEVQTGLYEDIWGEIDGFH